MYITKNEMVFEELKKEILNGILKPGEKLIISNISKMYGVSDIPVREALKQLEATGFVFSKAHAGFHVAPMSKEEILKIFEIRLVLEVYCVGVSVPRIPDQVISELEKMVESEVEFIRNQDSQIYRTHNFAFHQTIYKYCGNDRLLNMIVDLWDNTKRYPSQFLVLENMKKSYAEHQEIVKAIKSRDVALVQEMERKHKQTAVDHILGIVQNTIDSVDREE